MPRANERRPIPPLTGRGKRKLAFVTISGVASCLAISVIFNHLLFLGDPDRFYAKGLLAAVVLPILLATPLFIFLSLKLRELSILNRQLRAIADHDHLTGLLTRGAFLYLFADRRPRKGGALLLVDIDHFKLINDHYGHAAGDIALAEIAAHLGAAAGGEALVGRFGGEEFGIYLPGAATGQARYVAEDLRERIATSRVQLSSGASIAATVSVGVIVWSAEEGFETLYQSADRELYRAKAAGRNRIELAEIARVPDRYPLDRAREIIATC